MLLSDITGCDCMYLESSTWAAGCCSCCIWNLLLPSSKLMWVSALYVSFGFSYHRPSLLFTLMLIPIWLYASNCCMRRSMATASCPRCWVDVAGLHITFQVIIVNAGMEPIASFLWYSNVLYSANIDQTFSGASDWARRACWTPVSTCARTS